jgi:hypothetical protein
MFFTTSRNGCRLMIAPLRLLAEHGAMLIACQRSARRKLVVGELELLQAQHVDGVRGGQSRQMLSAN